MFELPRPPVRIGALASVAAGVLLIAGFAGSLGVVAYLVIILGTSFASWIFSSDVTFVPVIAAESPAL
jgi:hypothetical protein